MLKTLAAGGVWGTGRGESHVHVAPGFPLGPGHNNWGLVRDLNVHEVR